MRFAACSLWSVATLFTWLLTTGLAPAVALHVALEHDGHSPSRSDPHAHSDHEPLVHDDADHHHTQVGFGLTRTGIRQQPPTLNALPGDRTLGGFLQPVNSSCPHWLDSRAQRQHFTARSPVLLL